MSINWWGLLCTVSNATAGSGFSDEMLTRIASIIGCVTGVAGLILSFYTYLVSMPHLHVRLPRPNITGLLEMPSDRLGSRFRLIIPIALTNTGNNPTSLTDVDARCRSFTLRHLAWHDPIHVSFARSDHSFVSFMKAQQPMPLPICLEPGKTIETLLVFLVDDTECRQLLKVGNVRVRFRGPSITHRTRIPIYHLTLENIEQYTEKHRRH